MWLEPDPTRIVWFTFLASMDEDGFSRFASPANVAYRARVSMEAGEAAIKTLESPDPNSSDPDNDGRRIERVPGGWIVLNARKYRELATRETIKESTRKRVAAFRSRKKGNDQVPPCNESVTHEKHKETQSDTDTETEEEAPDFPPIVLAQKVASELCLTGPGLIPAIAGAIVFLGKFENLQPHSAVNLLIVEGKAAIERREVVNQFWFSDRKWRTGKSPPADEHGGHYEGNVYVTPAGVRMPGYTPPPKPRAKGTAV